jgi:adenylylsulfate kinase
VPSHTGFAIWLTGLPASGKSTLARELARDLKNRGMRVQILDSDELRQVLTPTPTYSEEERTWFYQVTTYLGQLLTNNGINVIFAATANRRSHREEAREAIERFVEIYVRCSLETCMERDEKGIYEKGLTGQAKTVPGLQIPYESPETPDLIVDTEQHTANEGVGQILALLDERSYLTGER